MQETKLKLLERIVDRRQDSLYRFAYIRTGSQADAEDIVQDVLLRLFHSDCNLDRIDDVERYLWRAIANRCEATVKSRFRYGIGKLRKLINH